MPARASPACLAIAVSALLAGCSVRHPQMNFLMAYSEVEMTQQSATFPPIVDDKGGGMFSIGGDGAVGKIAENGSSFRLGGRLPTSFYHEEISDRIVAGEPDLEIEEFVDLMLFTPELTASYRQILGNPKQGAFIEPGVGLGVSVGNLLFGSELQFGDDTIGVDYDEDEWEVGFAVTPFLRGGVALDRVLVGVEGGYRWSTLDFDAPFGKDPSEWYAGVFLAVTLGPPSQ